MEIYVFASDTLTNIWAGVGSERWAVAPTDEGAFAKGRITKARKMPIGAFGILYCKATKALTVPFVVYSKADEVEEVNDVWPEKWVLPFRIKPLGTPEKSMKIDEAKALLSAFKQNPMPAFDKVFHVRGDFAFQTSEISAEDWAILIQELAV